MTRTDTLSAADNRSAWFRFLAVTIVVGSIAAVIAHAGSGNSPLALAATLDLALTVPAAWYWLMIRPGRRSMATLALVTIAGLFRAASLFPRVVPGKLWIGAGFEVAVVALIVTALRRARNKADSEPDADPLERLNDAVSTLFAGVAARLVATELSVFYYAFNFRAEPHVPRGNPKAFTLHEKSGASVLVGCLAAVSVLEIVPVHLLIHRWSGTAAWIATAVSIWGVAWMVALARAFRLRPTLVVESGTEPGIRIRFGLLFNLFVPAEALLEVLPGSMATADTRTVPKGCTPTTCIKFRYPLNARLLAGITRRVESIALAPDDPTGFALAVGRLMS